MLSLYNTATRSKQAFKPVDDKHVTMYVCGPTVYNFIHIGNARPVVVFDVLYRVLSALYEKVSYARNITDIDDKIIQLSVANDEPIIKLTERYTAEYVQDCEQLLCLPTTYSPKATEHVEPMLELIAKLIERGHAYATEGHVLFAVESMQDYGKLSNRSLEDMLDGARVEVARYKRYAGDFVLWKPSNDKEPGWDSPWGRGRPGWHLECSAMISAIFGDTIDIHGGGRDLIFPHHENEQAQSCCANEGKNLANYWVHNGYLNIDGEKMSKSLGNFHTVRELLEKYRGEVLRYALLSSQYRSDADFSNELLQQAESSLNSLYGFLRNVTDVDACTKQDIDLKQEPAFIALLDDINSPVAIAELYKLCRSLGQASVQQLPKLKARVLKVADVLGLLQQDPNEWFQQNYGSDSQELSNEEITLKIQQRQQAKLDKDYVLSDQIREDLLKQNVQLEDSREGTQWKRI